MTIHCILYSRHGCNPITETTVETPVFLAVTDNPFPASELTSMVLSEHRINACYTVRDLKQWEKKELESPSCGQ